MLDCLKNACSAVKDFFDREWTTEEKILVILCCVMYGVIQGLLLAPGKRSSGCGNQNGKLCCESEEK